MTWKLTAWAKTRAGVTGIEWRDLTDEEFDALEAEHPELRQRGYFEHHENNPEHDVADEASPETTQRARPQRRTP
jgi:hypothetical protein